MCLIDSSRVQQPNAVLVRRMSHAKISTCTGHEAVARSLNHAARLLASVGRPFRTTAFAIRRLISEPSEVCEVCSSSARPRGGRCLARRTRSTSSRPPCPARTCARRRGTPARATCPRRTAPAPLGCAPPSLSPSLPPPLPRLLRPALPLALYPKSRRLVCMRFTAVECYSHFLAEHMLHTARVCLASQSASALQTLAYQQLCTGSG